MLHAKRVDRPGESQEATGRKKRRYLWFLFARYGRLFSKHGPLGLESSHRQSVSAVKNGATPTEPQRRLAFDLWTMPGCAACVPFCVSTLRAHSPQLQHRGKGHDGRALFFDCKEKHRKLLDWIIKTVWKQVKTFYHSGFAMMIGKSKPILRWKKWMEKSKEVKRDAHTVEKRWQKTWEELRREGKLPRDHESCDKNRNDFLRAAAKSGEQMVGLEKRWGKMRTDSQNMLSMTWSSTSAPIGKPRLWIL